MKANRSSVPSINSLFENHLHPDLVKLQCKEGSNQSDSKVSESLNKKSCKKRTVNNTMTIHGVVEKVGTYIMFVSKQNYS
ncbi:MAG: hypothetical protein GY830_06710 [Bacteroidetes bacterium]|nr:hypothetical protein [Bacteroidota bacterium]